MTQPAAGQPNGGVLLPPVGVCAVCKIPLGKLTDRVTLTFEVFHTGAVVGKTYLMHACCTLHAADAMRRLSRLVEDRVHLGPGGVDLSHPSVDIAGSN